MDKNCDFAPVWIPKPGGWNQAIFTQPQKEKIKRLSNWAIYYGVLSIIFFFIAWLVFCCIFDVSDFAESMKNKVVKLDFC